MCGIVGINRKDEPTLSRMLNSITHRGPDGEGKFVDNNFSLGMRRLAIIDPNGGWQPIWNEDKSLCIFMNGEIYNYEELWEKLAKNGHKFSTDHSDTETVLHGYEEYGSEVLKFLTGMFAIVIYDIKKQEIFIARDRLGIKPLYYFTKNESIAGNSVQKVVYASEIKALLETNEIAPKINKAILYEYLAYRVHDSKEETFFEGIKRLLPGHYMIVNSKGIQKISKYWEPKFTTEFTSQKSDEDYAQEFYTMYKEAMKRHIVADVPVGVTLSGGLDSSGVTCMIRELLNEGSTLNTEGNKLYSFSALFPGLSIDESKYIHEVEKFANTTPIYAYPNVDTFWQEMDNWIYTQEEPTISSAPYAYYSVYKEASKHVKVTLSGNGGDELLAGYIPYFRSYLTSATDSGNYFSAGREILKGFDLYKSFIFDKIDAINPLRTILKEKYPTLSARNLLDSKYQSENSAFVFNADRNLNKRLMQDVLQYSTPNLLRYEDKNSMAFSLEARVPFLDHKLVEYIFNLPIDQKIKNGWNRYVYRQAMKGHIPESIRTRRSKIGFTNPELAWMKAKKDTILEIFNSSEFSNRGLYNTTEITNSFTSWVNGDKKYAGDPLLFWRILNTELWIRRFKL
jgi:asparagine synthase (glutamine-hydrolysing)